MHLASRILILISLTLPGVASAEDRPCAWLFEPTHDRENILFPEVTTRYLAALIPALPGGGHVEVAGEFPHARYMSLQTYTVTLQSISNLPDHQIEPDEGSINPYVPGANRSAANRKYTVRVLFEAVPESGRPPNSLYYLGDQGSRVGAILVYRIYLADAEAQPFGAVPVPALTEVLPGGQRIPIPECPEIVPDTSPLTLFLANAGLAEYVLPEIGLFGRAQPQWRKYVNAPTGYTDMLTNNEVLGPTNAPLRGISTQLPAGLGENVDNKYVYTGLAREYGDVALIRARMPVTPQTYSGEPLMEQGQLRFWSLCTGNRASMTYGCLIDREVPLDAEGYFSVAISVAANRPGNATPECGIGWIPWGPDVITSVIMRNMLPSAEFFPNSVQAAEQGTEAETLGPYYPSVTYYASAADFESAVGCQAPAYLPGGNKAIAAASGTRFGGALAVELVLLGWIVLAGRQYSASARRIGAQE